MEPWEDLANWVQSEVRRDHDVALADRARSARIEGILVEAADQLYIIPIDAISELVDLSRSARVKIGASEYIWYDDRLLRLSNLVAGRDGRMAAVIESGERLLAVRIEQALERVELEFKPLGQHLEPMPGIGGACMLQDGRVALIVDVATLPKEPAA